MYKNYSLLSSIKDKFSFINKFYDKIKDFKNSGVLNDNIDKKNRVLNVTLTTYKNLLNAYKSEYLENIENYDKELQEKYDYKNLKYILAKDLLNLNLSCINDNKLYQNVREDVFDRYKKDNKSPELLSIANFLDKIDNEYIKNKKDAREELNIVKQNVSSEALKEIMKYLEQAIFGYDDKDDKSDENGLEYSESIAERVKKRREKESIDEKASSIMCYFKKELKYLNNKEYAVFDDKDSIKFKANAVATFDNIIKHYLATKNTDFIKCYIKLLEIPEEVYFSVTDYDHHSKLKDSLKNSKKIVKLLIKFINRENIANTLHNFSGFEHLIDLFYQVEAYRENYPKDFAKIDDFIRLINSSHIKDKKTLKITN